MIALGWMLFALLALLWTAGAWITAAVTGWTAQAFATGTAAQAARDITALPLPEWLKFWIDPAWLQALQTLAQGAVDAAGAWLPLAGNAAGWHVAAIWIAWGLGLLLLLLAAAVVHFLVRRFSGNHAGHRMARAST